MIARSLLLALSCLVACGSCVLGCGGSSVPPNVRATDVETPAPPPPSSVTTVKDEAKPEPFKATDGPGDVPVAHIKDERSSRLEGAIPAGRVFREQWSAPLGSTIGPSYVLSAGNHVAVVGADAWVLFDTSGKRLGSGKSEGGAMRLDRVSGAVVPDETSGADTPADAKVAAHDGLVVMVKGGGVFIGERAIEGRFEAYEVAIDDNAVANVVLRQGNDLMLWTVPLSAGSGIGRHRIPGGFHHVAGPPILGRRVRVLSFDSGLLALGLDGKKLWERRGAPTGGASITADDQVLVADANRLLLVDLRGKTSEVWSAKDGVVFASPPILSASGVLYVAGRDALHALSPSS